MTDSWAILTISQLGGCGCMGRGHAATGPLPRHRCADWLSPAHYLTACIWDILASCLYSGRKWTRSVHLCLCQQARYEQEVTTWKGHFYTMATSNNWWCHMADKYRKGDTHTHMHATWHGMTQGWFSLRTQQSWHSKNVISYMRKKSK